MRNYCILNGKDSRAIDGLLISELPPIVKPAIRTSVTEIDGRDGDIVEYLGYSAYDKPMVIGLYGNYDINRVISFFDSEGVATFSNEPDKIYKYRIVEQIDYERLASFRTATVIFHCQPFKFSIAESPRTLNAAQIVETGQSITLSPTYNNENLSSFALCGNCEQSGAPTLQNPVNISTVTGTNPIKVGNSSGVYVRPLNFGTGELCKVGAYRDVIFKNGGKWYKTTAIGKMSVDMSSVFVSTYANRTEVFFSKPTDGLCYGNTSAVRCLATCANFAQVPGDWESTEIIGHIYTQKESNDFMLGVSPQLTESEIRAALENTFIYYPKTWRIDEEITDAALVENLESVLSTPLADGYTTITTDPATGSKPIITASAVTARSSVANIGNIYSRPKLTVYGNGTITIYINDLPLFVLYMGAEGHITIDGEQMDAYNETGLKNRIVSGDYDKLRLNVGENTVAAVGNVEKLVIENYSRWI